LNTVITPQGASYDKPLCASRDGRTLHAAMPAGAFHLGDRKALLRYVLRPAVTQERVDRVASCPSG